MEESGQKRSRGPLVVGNDDPETRCHSELRRTVPPCRPMVAAFSTNGAFLQTGGSRDVPNGAVMGQARFVTQCRGVRRFVAILLVAFIALLPAVDSLACPDGCS